MGYNPSKQNSIEHDFKIDNFNLLCIKYRNFT